MDWAKFRAYLKQDFSVEVAYLFMGYMPEHQEMYSSLQKAGYIVVFKPVSVNREGEVKGNIDAELVLQTMIDFDRFDEALIVTGDGDFASLISHLCNKNKLAGVLIPNQRQFSPLLKSAAKDKVFFINNLRRDLEYRRYNNHKSVASPESRVESPSDKTTVTQSPIADRATTSSPSSSPEVQASNPVTPTQNSQLSTRDSKLTTHNSSSRGTSTRSLEDSIISATSAPAATPPTRKPRPPRRQPASGQTPTQT